MIVKFMGQLDWDTDCPDIWLHIISGCVCECVSGLSEAIAFPSVGGYNPICWRPK